jgi:hypothetical protein
MTKRNLTTAPTTGLWLQEIRDLVSGELDAYIREVGSAEEYVERILGDSKNRRLTRDTFLDALTEHLTAWQPDRDGVDDYEIVRTSELISAFTPRVGFSKLLGLLEHWLSVDALATSDPEQIETRMRCLSALEMYYERVPIGSHEDPALHGYLKFLSALLREPLFVSYSLRRLLDLGVKGFVTPIVNERRLLDIAVQDAAQEYAVNRSTHLIESICRACLMSGVSAMENLSDALENAGTTPTFGDHELRVSYSAGEIEIAVPEGFEIVYYAARVGIEQRRGIKEFGSFVFEDEER